METPFSGLAPERASYFGENLSSVSITVRDLDNGSLGAARGLGPRKPVTFVRAGGRELSSYGLKRAMDVSVALASLVLLAPLLATIWVLIVTTSPGSGLYWSSRIGRFGRPFQMPKFRTMRTSAPVGPRETLQDADALITRVGAILRRTSIDELPQLYCVLRGDMSLVGPRPLLPDDPGALARHEFPSALDAKPGLTGIAQINGRNQVSARRKARLDALYARSISLSLDIGIIAKTVGILFNGRGFV